MCGLLLLVVVLAASSDVGHSDKNDTADSFKVGPFVIPDWNTPRFSDLALYMKIETIVYEEEVSCFLFSARVWRYALDWSFLAVHTPSENSLAIIPGKDEAIEWGKNQKCKVGPTYTTTRERECWKNLDEVKRDNWIERKILRRDLPARKGYTSTCSMYWSCDIHEVKFPVYIKVGAKNEPYISGPAGQIVLVGGDGDYSYAHLQDSFITFRTVKRKVAIQKNDARCLFKEDVRECICTVETSKGQVALKFEANDEKKSFNNFVFFKPNEEEIEKAKKDQKYAFSPSVGRAKRSEADSATKGDLKELETKLLTLSQEMVFEYHSLIIELSNIKHAMKELILSTAKVDDNLLGKIAKMPVKSTWLSDEVFLLSASHETLMHHSKTISQSTCTGSYSYENGRWKLKYNEFECSKWEKVTEFAILSNNLFEPTLITEAPKYRNASSEYSGWSYLDNGRVSLDWLDKSIKYKDKGSGFGDIFDNLNFLNIFGTFSSLIVGIIVVVLFLFVCKR